MSSLKSISISRCKSFLLFYNKKSTFFILHNQFVKTPHQIIYNTPSFIKIILSHIFIIISLTHTRLHHLTTHHFSKHSLSFFFSFFFLLSSFFFSFFLLLPFFLLQYLFSFSILSFFFFFISKKKKKISLSPPFSLSNRCSLQIWKISLYQASMAQYTHTLSHGGSELGFWVDLCFSKWVFCYVLFWVDFALSWF